MPEEKNQSPTARPTKNPVGINLAKTQGQRGAEILAGLRHILTPSPETKALHTLLGLVGARMVTRLEKNKAALNFVAARLDGITALAERHMSDAGDFTFVEIAAGFSPRGIQIARSHPQATIIEIDLPDVVEEKQKRLSDLSGDITYIAADLGVTPVGELLGETKADVVVAEGLNAYFPPEEITQIAAAVREVLKPGGVYISDIPWEKGMQRAIAATRIFSRQAGEFKGVMPDAASMEELMKKAGYAQVTAYQPSEHSEELGIPSPVLDFSFFVVATNK